MPRHGARRPQPLPTASLLALLCLAAGALAAGALAGCEGTGVLGQAPRLIILDGPGAADEPPPGALIPPAVYPGNPPPADDAPPGEPPGDPAPAPDPAAPDPAPAPGPAPVTPAPSGQLCDECTGRGQCGDEANLCLQTPAGERFCGRDCSSGAACPLGYECQPIGDSSGGVLAEQCVPAALTCGRAPATPPAPGPGGDAVPPTADIAAQEQHLLELINADRARTGQSCAAPVQLHAGASAVARAHSQWMAESGILSHDDPDGDPFTRLGRAGIRFAGASENAACGGGCASVDQAEQLFMSEGPGGGHYENILDCRWTHVGVGVAVDARGRVWVTQDFLQLY